MKVEFRRSFERDLRGIREAETLARIRESIEQIEQAARSGFESRPDLGFG